MFRNIFLLPSLLSAVIATNSPQIVPGGYIVQLEHGSDASSLLKHVDATKIMDLNSPLFQGVSIQVNNVRTAKEQVAQIKSLPIVKNVWPKKLFARPDAKIRWTGTLGSTGSASRQSDKRAYQNDTWAPHVQTQVDKLHARGITGKGVKIAVVDTGIDYKNPALGGCFGADCLVIGGYDFVGDNFNGNNDPVPDNDPYDNCAGHGSHVAGIIAAQKNEYGFTGVAPGAKLLAYRVFGCNGSTSNDVLMAAFMRAYDDGANIITASLGGPLGWSEDESSVLLSQIVDKGRIVTVAAGNDGDTGLFYSSAPAGGKNVAAIASFDNAVTPSLLTNSRYAIGSGPEKVFEYSIGAPRKWAGVKLPLWAPSFNINEKDQGCKPYPESTPDLSNKVVLIRRGTCPFEVKAQNAAARGAQYIIFYNNVTPGAIFTEVDIASIRALGMVPADLGITWVNALASGQTVTLDMLDPNTEQIRLEQIVNNKTGGSLSDYTSWGPSFEADVKPQFGAPGGDILSTYPVALGSFAVASGTSMATPFAAAIYALIATVRNTFDPLVLQNVLAATAKPAKLNDGGISPMLAPVAQQGAGLLQAYDAAYATTILSISSLAFNDTAHLREKNFTISNTGHHAVTYQLDVIGTATAYTFSNSTTPDSFPGIKFDNNYARVELSKYKVTVPAGGKSTVRVKVTLPSNNQALLPVYGGYISLNATNGERLSLPYQGIAGDMSAHSVLNGTYVSRLSAAPDFGPIPPGNSTAFLIPPVNNTDLVDLPVIVLGMTLGSPLINVELLSTSNHSRNLGPIMGSPFMYVGRSSQQAVWTGQLANQTWMPAGSYKFRVSALHIFGHPGNKKQYDVAESGAFSIYYK